jgi:hypothetical protein
LRERGIHFVYKGLLFWRVALLVFCLCFSQWSALRAQVPVSVQTEPIDTARRPRQIDIADVIGMILNLKKNPMRKSDKKGATGPFYSIIANPGYAIATGVAAIATINISFRTKKNPKGDLSFVNSQVQYTQYNQVIVQSVSNFYTNNQKWQFPGDIRFMHFPTATYGLGSNSLPSASDNIDYYYFRFYRNVLRKVHTDTYVGIGYNMDYRWKIEDYNAMAGAKSTPFTQYGYSRTSMSSGLSATFLYDSRDNPNRAIRGEFINVQFDSYLKPFGSMSNWNSLTIDIRKYVSLTPKWYAVMAFWGYAWITLNGKPPYLDLPSIGWDSYNNTGRGYAAGRYRGGNMFYFETELRFDILRNGLLGGVVFGNMQTFSDYPGRSFGMIQPGGGAGLRIKFNKYTNANASVDYGVGSHGSRGFSTNLNEVF